MTNDVQILVDRIGRALVPRGFIDSLLGRQQFHEFTEFTT